MPTLAEVLEHHYGQPPVNALTAKPWSVWVEGHYTWVPGHWRSLP
jgi:hypothetical protein